jgi:hypothetical protein
MKWKLFVVHMLAVSILFSCSGKNKNDSDVSAQVLPDAIVFSATGSSFEPVLIVTGSPSILWTFDDGTTSTSATPVKNYGSAGNRKNSLKVTPWSSVQRINIGYTADDGGDASIEKVTQQNVVSVSGLELVAPTLRQWCSSYNPVTSLDFSNFVQLDTVECFKCTSLSSIALINVPQLQRLCVEYCNLPLMNFSDIPRLQDLRGALNSATDIVFGAIGAETWHICVRENRNLTNTAIFSNTAQFPNIAELFLWNNNQTGILKIPSTSSTRFVSICAWENAYTSADFSGSMKNASANAEILMQNNKLTTVNISGCVQLTNLNLSRNSLNETAVDYVLGMLDSLGRANGTVDLRFNAAPSAAGLASALNLSGKGWTVYVDPVL